MTVCVAAICEYDRIVCVTDQMLTLYEDWNWQSEQDWSKLFSVDGSLVVMYSGDAALAHEVVGELRNKLKPDALSVPPSVAELAGEYSAAWVRVQRRRIEREILAEYELTFTEWMTVKRRVRPIVAEGIEQAVREYNMPVLEAILAGVDPNRVPHLWTASGPSVRTADHYPFVAIGIGAPHAYAELLPNFPHRGMPFGKAALRAYAAKKKADASVGGVGRTTEVCTCGPGPLQLHRWWPGQEVSYLDGIYENMLKVQNAAFDDMADAVQAILGRPLVIPTTPPLEPPSPSAPQPLPESKHGP